MGFEFLYKASEQAKNEGREKKSTSISRRELLLGGGALAGASVLKFHESWVSSIVSQEDREKNAEAIRAYEQRLKKYRYILEDETSSVQEIMDIISTAPALEQHVLKGTTYDHDAFFRKNASWPSVQVRFHGPDTDIRFAHQPNEEAGNLLGYGNAFFVDSVFISNRHVIEDRYHCEFLSEADIAGCSSGELLDTIKSSDSISASTIPIQDIACVELQWDRVKAQEDLHGKTVHITSIHEERGEFGPNNTDVTPGTLIKITPNMLRSESNPDGFLSASINYHGEIIDRPDILERSYMCIIAPRDINKDDKADYNDVAGISGSPAFSDDDCKENRAIPSGIIWGAGTIVDYKKKVSYVVALLHGPDVLGEMIDTIHTVVSQNMDEENFSQKRALTLKVQEALQSYGYDIEADSEYGPKTTAAVTLFQESIFNDAELKSHVIPGTVDRRTWAKLFLEEDRINKSELYASLSDQ